MSESQLSLARKIRKTDFGTFEDDGRFVDTKVETPIGTLICHNDGTFTDVTNRLMWIQAPWGMTWGGENLFRGEPIRLNWFEATKLFGKGARIPFPGGALPKQGVEKYLLSEKYKPGICTVTFAKYSNWRLPTAKEFLTLGDYSVDVTHEIFPKLPHFNGLNFWSANDQTTDLAWSKHQLFGELVYEKLSDTKKYDCLNILFVRNFLA